MSEAAARVAAHVFSEFDTVAMVAGYFEGNEGSARILQRLALQARKPLARVV